MLQEGKEVEGWYGLWCPKDLSEWCVLVKKLQAKVDIKSDDKHTLVLKSA